jgi:16S rRNA (guanine527-N7)-methyltransferase
MDKNWQLLAESAAKFNISLSQEQLDLFKEYWLFLDEYNSHTNLVSSTDQKTVIEKHFIDSLAIGLYKDTIGWDTEKRIIDIGIGGGFPGIPILMANPKWKLCAVDSVGKKTKFIELLAQKLGISDRVEVRNERAEILARDKDLRESFDLVASRAVGQLPILLEYCQPFIKEGGYFMAYKAKDIETEINQSKKALSILGGDVCNIISYSITEGEPVERNLVLIKKVGPTPDKYPRKEGVPKKNPLV